MLKQHTTTNNKEGKMKKYRIEVSGETPEGADFVAWLNEQGHDAKLGRTSGDYVDGVGTNNIEANEIMRTLWEEYE
jgi:hypothetical protein